MQDELIERYLAGELSMDEKASFEKKIQEDAQFRAELEAYQNIVDNLKSVRNQELKERLIRLEGSAARKGSFLDRRIFFAIVFISALALIAWFVILNNRSVTEAATPTHEIEPPPKTPGVEDDTPASFPSMDEDSIHFLELNRIKSKDNPAAKKIDPIAVKTDKNKLLASNFKPYIDDDLIAMVRGSGDMTNYEKFIDLYLKKDYAKALEMYDELEVSLGKSDNMLFLKANLLLGLKRSGEARVILESIVKNDRSRYTLEAKKYLRYCR